MGESFRINMAAPNLVNVCIDERTENGSSGRLYCYYDREPILFRNEYHLLKLLEELMERIDYPQSSVKLRSYFADVSEKQDKPQRAVGSEKMLDERGRQATFFIQVQYRQNATWQGDLAWTEQGAVQKFRSALELLKLMDSAKESEKDSS